MKRTVVLGVLMGVGALSLTVAAQRGGGQGQAQGPNVVTLDKIKDNLYVGKGGGGNSAIFITANGVVVVDTKNPGWGQPLLDKIKTISTKPITMVINTHTHGDHTSGQLEFPGTFEVVTQENTKANMEKMDAFKTSEGAKRLPTRAFKDKLSLGSGNDKIDLYYFGPGHTNGDAWVVFPALQVVHAGDIFAGKNVPLVDYGNGGSGARYADTLNKAHSGIKSVNTIITGHSDTTMTWADLKQYADFNTDFKAWVQSEMKAGKTPEQAAMEYKVPDKYPGFGANLPPFFGGMAGYLKSYYGELGGK